VKGNTMNGHGSTRKYTEKQENTRKNRLIRRGLSFLACFLILDNHRITACNDRYKPKSICIMYLVVNSVYFRVIPWPLTPVRMAHPTSYFSLEHRLACHWWGLSND